jgi:predicted negative regulator of RcsB-dependent stress response
MQSDAAESLNLLKLRDWYEANKKLINYGGLGLIVVGLVVWFILWHQSQKEVNAGEALTSASMAQAPGPSGSTPDSANAFLKIAAEYPNSGAGARALLLAAGNLFDAGKYPEAKAQFQRFVREHRDSPFTPEALLGVASCFDAEGQTNDAMAAYKDLIDHHPGDAVLPQAKFALARLYETQGKPELAKNLYEDVERADAYGSLGPEAGMRVEELILKYPSLAPKPVATPAAPTGSTAIPTISFATNSSPASKPEKK